MNAEEKQCQNCKVKFLVEPDDFGFYEKIGVPAPTFCPQCRRQRRLSWRNDFFFYYRTCGLCKKRVVSIYSPSSKRVIYCGKCWWSDRWNPEDYARDYNFSRPFFEQFKELQEKVPVPALMNDDEAGSVNCEYTQDFAFSKNCYMTFVGWRVEDCMYSAYLSKGKNVVDSMIVFDNTDSVYECIFVTKAFRCRNVYYSYDILDSAFLYDCRDCADCFLCAGLRHKRYCIKNVQYTKEEYEKILDSYGLDTHAGTEKAHREFGEFILSHPRQPVFQMQCMNVVGDEIDHSKNVYYGFNSGGMEDCRYIESCDNSKNCYDLSVGGEANECYESITPDQSYRDLFTIHCWKNVDAAYSEVCYGSKNLFGCVAMRYGDCAILNKRYTKEEYQNLKGKIIARMKEDGAWGEFFPSSMSPFGYNETIAQLYYPLTKEQASKQRFRWQDELQFTQGKETIKPDTLPEAIKDVKDNITNEILACISCSRNYRLIPAELTFYRKMSIPIPRKCFYCRNEARFRMRNPFHLWHRRCGCAGRASENARYSNIASHVHGENRCSNEFETSYAPDRTEIVYCKACYNSEIV